MIQQNNYLHTAYDNAPAEATKEQNMQDIHDGIQLLEEFYYAEEDRPEPPPTPDQEAVRRLKDIFMKILRPHEI